MSDKELSESLNWKQHVENPDAKVDVKTVSDTISCVMETVYRIGTHAIRLDELDFTKVNTTHLQAVLRFTFLKRDEIVGWHDAVEKCAVLLESRGKNANSQLAGLRKKEKK